MATISKQEAVDLIRQEIAKAKADDLAEYYNELFPEPRRSVAEAERNRSVFLKEINQQIDHGLEEEEILDLWNVIYPKHRRVQFDEDGKEIHYEEEFDPVYQDD